MSIIHAIRARKKEIDYDIMMDARGANIVAGKPFNYNSIKKVRSNEFHASQINNCKFSIVISTHWLLAKCTVLFIGIITLSKGSRKCHDKTIVHAVLCYIV
jgi:hypothetical protein